MTPHEKALLTLKALEIRKKRKEEGKKQAEQYMYHNKCKNIGIRTYKKNGRVIIPCR